MSDITSPLTSMDEREIVRMIRTQARDQSARRGWRCPSAEQVAAYLDQNLAGEDKARFEVHLASCDFCIDLISSLVHQQETKEPIDVPAPLLRQAIATVPERVPAGRSWRWVLVPVLATIVIVSAVLLKLPQPVLVTPPDIPAPAVEKATPSVPVSKSQSKPSGTREVRSLKTQTTSLQLLEPRSGSIVRGQGLSFRWKAVAKIMYYEIRVVDSEGDPVWQAESTAPGAQVPSNVSLRPGKYFVWVRAYLTDGRTLKSDTITFQIASSS